ncbi:hypothetical protein C6497_11090 [Candidatus Poribacteria bacterium]|nr:MAG: hypothetical protein C6497_11090 [Candidatus Poribacteria bacterium]
MSADSEVKSDVTQLKQDKDLDYYEIALYFAAVKAKDEEFRWEQFIDNLSYICDHFANHIEINSRVNQ